LRREHRLTPAGLPDSSARSSDHSVSSHQRDDRGSPGCQRICPRLDRLRHSVEGSPVHADRIEFTTAPASGTCVTDWSFSLRCSPPRITATQLRLNTPRLFAAGERTLTAPTQHHLRRTTADRPGPQQHSWWKGSGMLQTTSTERRAAGGDRPRSGGSVKRRPKLQIPIFKSQRNPKLKTPNRGGKLPSAAGVLALRIGASLELGAWNLELGI